MRAYGWKENISTREITTMHENILRRHNEPISIRHCVALLLILSVFIDSVYDSVLVEKCCPFIACFTSSPYLIGEIYEIIVQWTLFSYRQRHGWPFLSNGKRLIKFSFAVCRFSQKKILSVKKVSTSSLNAHFTTRFKVVQSNADAELTQAISDFHTVWFSVIWLRKCTIFLINGIFISFSKHINFMTLTVLS